jgi:hypothetical protein
MAIDSILAQIDAEIATLKQARSLLASAGLVTTAVTEPTTQKKRRKSRKRRTLSLEARKRIADAQRKRWAAQKAKAK